MNTITLIGTEQMQSAASVMRQAAENMQRAASQIDGSLRRHDMFLESWLAQFKDVVETIGSWEHSR